MVTAMKDGSHLAVIIALARMLADTVDQHH